MSLTHAISGLAVGVLSTIAFKVISKYFAVDKAEPMSQALREAIKETVVENEAKIPDIEKALVQEIKDDFK